MNDCVLDAFLAAQAALPANATLVNENWARRAFAQYKRHLENDVNRPLTGLHALLALHLIALDHTLVVQHAFWTPADWLAWHQANGSPLPNDVLGFLCYKYLRTRCEPVTLAPAIYLNNDTRHASFEAAPPAGTVVMAIQIR